MDVMDTTMELQRELYKKLEKVAAGIAVVDVDVKGDPEKKETEERSGGGKRKRGEEVKQEHKGEESSSRDSSSSSSSSSEEEEEDGDGDQPEDKEQKTSEVGKKTTKTNELFGSTKVTRDLNLARKALKIITNVVKTTDKSIQFDMKTPWAEALFEIKLILNRQSSCDAHTTDNAAAEVTAQALEAAADVFQKLGWTDEHVKEVRSVIAALTDACSKNELLRIYFHRVRAQLESLEMSFSSSATNTAEPPENTRPAISSSSKPLTLKGQLEAYRNLTFNIQKLSKGDKPKRIIEALNIMQHVLARDVHCAHQREVRNAVENVKGWISETPCQNDLANVYRRFVSGITIYTKALKKDDQIMWQRLVAGIVKLLDKKARCAEAYSPVFSKKSQEMYSRLKSILAQVEQWQDGTFSLNQLDKLIKTLDEVVYYQSKDWDPLTDSTIQLCVEKLVSSIQMIKKQSHRNKRLKIVKKWKSRTDWHLRWQ